MYLSNKEIKESINKEMRIYSGKYFKPFFIVTVIILILTVINL